MEISLTLTQKDLVTLSEVLENSTVIKIFDQISDKLLEQETENYNYQNLLFNLRQEFSKKIDNIESEILEDSH